jgi:hypothetical protein
MKNVYLFLIMAIMTVGCTTNSPRTTSSSASGNIAQTDIEKVIQILKEKNGASSSFRIERGVTQVAGLWRNTDGTPEDFEKCCSEYFVTGDSSIENLYKKLERNLEICNGYFHRMDLQLKEPIQLTGPDPDKIDMLFGSYNASAHLNDDFFANQIAFITSLNFPHYSLKEKTEQGVNWNRREWAYARMGDQFTSRIPAGIIQHISQTLTAADAYISDYNIYMGRLIDGSGKTLFPGNMKLITHWGLRDELKSDYAAENGFEKQQTIYSVMQRIIDQSIPQQVINSNEYTWNPVANTLFREGKEVTVVPEADKRYEVLLANFRALKEADQFSPACPTYISRAFEEGMEIPVEDVERLFTEFVSSPLVKDVASLISRRLGRPLEPFDIWYNGFRSGGTVHEEELTKLTTRKYPDTEAVRKDLPLIMNKLGWKPEDAQRICSLITVDAARGSGHAWGATMRNDLAHLRSRIGETGMDYKGYNIAVHEFGHCVEQTITMNDVDHYMLNGVPNTAFTEAIAFLFQKRDLKLLGIQTDDPLKEHLLALDNFWSCYEIMGVSLVDIQVWKWLYAHPDAGAAQLKEAVTGLAKAIWNKYYAGIIGGNDEPILAIYSHMIDNPLYLSNYPVGHLIDFQIEKQVEGKNMAEEITRMLVQGRVIPQLWMKGAVGKEISISPTIETAGKALEIFKKM